MGKRLTLEEVKKYVKEMGDSELISDEYVGTKTKMQFKCNCGELFYTSLEKFKYQNKRKCNLCNGVKRWDYESVKEYISNNSESKLISDVYINYETKMLLLCKCGKEFKVSFDKFKNGQTECNECKINKAHDSLRFDYEYVKNYIEDNSNCKLLSSTYDNSNADLDIMCECGCKFKRTFYNFKVSKYKLCINCIQKINGIKSRNSINEVREMIKSYNCEWIDGEYVGRNSILKIKCSCGEVFEQVYDVFLRGSSHCCPKCSSENIRKSRMIGYKNIKNDIENNSDCKLITKDKGILYDTKIKLLCKCGNMFTSTYRDFSRSKNKQCKCCSGINEFTIEDVKDYISNNSNCEYIDGNYVNMYSRINIKCSCGNIFETTFGHFKFANKRQCNDCGYLISADKNKLPYEVVKSRIESNGNKLLSEEYINNTNKLKIRCKCGKTFYRSLDGYMSGGDCCDVCNKSKGEQYIYKFLEYNNINLIQQVQFKDCRYKKMLPFDFGIYGEDNKLLALIEYQGRQHYEFVKMFHRDESGFKIQQKRDNIKKEYCEKNNINLIEIPYWVTNIGEYLVKELEAINIASFIMQ